MWSIVSNLRPTLPLEFHNCTGLLINLREGHLAGIIHPSALKRTTSRGVEAVPRFFCRTRTVNSFLESPGCLDRSTRASGNKGHCSCRRINRHAD